MCAMKGIPTTLALFLTAVITTACGGSGGGLQNSDNVPTTALSINTSNAKTICAAVLDSVDTVKGTNFRTRLLPGVSMRITRGDFSYPEFITYQLTNHLSYKNLSGRIQSANSVSETSSCSISGSVTLTKDIATENTLTVGDKLTYSYSGCNNGKFIISGSMVMTFLQVSPSLDFSSPHTLGIDVELRDFSVTQNGLTATENGGITMLLVEDKTGKKNLRYSGNSLSLSSGSQEETLTNYLYDTQSTSSGDNSLTLQGTLTSTKVDGSVSYTSITAFASNDNLYSGNPTAGELHITPLTDSSQVWLIALSDGVNIEIDIDTDGDDMVDTTVMTTWSELQSL